jgi:hypothetical protein
VFIKLGPKHASKDEIKLVVFKVLGEILLAVQVLGFLRTVCDSELRLGFLLVHSIGYDTHKQAYNQQKKTCLTD